MTPIDTTLADYDVIAEGRTTIVRYDVITPGGGGAAKYRDRGAARIVARRDRHGRFYDIWVVVTWAGHGGSYPYAPGTHTLDSLAETADDHDGLLAFIAAADCGALESLIRSATDAHTEYIGNNMEIVDYSAVRATVAAALGEEPHLGIPVTPAAASKWLMGFDAPDFIQIVPA